MTKSAPVRYAQGRWWLRVKSQHFYALDGEHETHGDYEDGAHFEDVFVIFSGQRIAEQAEHEHANACAETEHEHQRRTQTDRSCGRFVNTQSSAA